MTGTSNQIEWAEQIKRRVDTEFKRVASAFREVAARQSDQAREDTYAILAILDRKRAAVMARQEAGYFIKDWQEAGDQIRQMIAQDPEFQAIQARRAQSKRAQNLAAPVPFVHHDSEQS